MTLGANIEQIDADTNLLHQIIHGTAAEDVTTEGGIVPTVAKRLASIGSGVARGAWATATVYALGDIVTNAGTNYRCAIAHTSSAAFATDAALARWVLLAVTTDLAQKSANLSDLANAAAARANLSVYSQAQVDVADAAVSAEVVAAEARNAGIKNLFANAGFRWWQRGATWSNVDNVTTADRWRVGGAAGTVVRNRRDTADGLINGTRNYIAVRPTSASAWAFYLAQTIEDGSALAGRQVTLSFYARYSSSNGAGKVISVRPGYQVYDSATNPTTTDAGVGSITINDTHITWQRYSFTFTMPNVTAASLAGGSPQDIAWSDIRLYFSTAVAAAGIDIGAIQLEAGATATRFSEQPPAIDQILCRRFFQRSLRISESLEAYNAANPADFGAVVVGQMVGASVANAFIAQVRYPVEMYPKTGAAPNIWNPVTASNSHPRNITRSLNLTNTTLLSYNAHGFEFTCTTVAGSAAGDRISFQWDVSAEPLGNN